MFWFLLWIGNVDILHELRWIEITNSSLSRSCESSSFVSIIYKQNEKRNYDFPCETINTEIFPPSGSINQTIRILLFWSEANPAHAFIVFLICSEILWDNSTTVSNVHDHIVMFKQISYNNNLNNISHRENIHLNDHIIKTIASLNSLIKEKKKNSRSFDDNRSENYKQYLMRNYSSKIIIHEYFDEFDSMLPLSFHPVHQTEIQSRINVSNCTAYSCIAPRWYLAFRATPMNNSSASGSSIRSTIGLCTLCASIVSVAVQATEQLRAVTSQMLTLQRYSTQL